MSKYYVVECYGGDQPSSITTEPDLDLDWWGGVRFSQPPQESLVFEIEEEDEGPLRLMYKAGILLLRDDVVEALRESGVDNLDCYDAVIREIERGVDHTNYKVVNIVGLVSAADMSKSDAKDLSLGGTGMGANFFRHLELDESKIHGQLMFRLAEYVMAIVVHKKVRDYLLEKGFDELSFFEPAEWPG